MAFFHVCVFFSDVLLHFVLQETENNAQEKHGESTKQQNRSSNLQEYTIFEASGLVQPIFAVISHFRQKFSRVFTLRKFLFP